MRQAPYKSFEEQAFSMPKSDLMMLCDMGFYNDVIRGYLIEAMRIAEFDNAEIRRALSGLKTAFDDTAAEEAVKKYFDFH